MNRRGAFAAIGLLVLAGCRRDMADQPHYEPLEASTFFADGAASRPLPAHTIARGQLREDTHFFTGRVGGELGSGKRPRGRGRDATDDDDDRDGAGDPMPPSRRGREEADERRRRGQDKLRLAQVLIGLDEPGLRRDYMSGVLQHFSR